MKRKKNMPCLVVLLVAWAVALAGCAVNPVTGRQELAFYRVDEAKEIKLGERAYPAAIQQMHGEYRDPVLKAYVNRVGLRLARVSERPSLPWKFTVVNDSSPNAFALPGGHIAITRGLLTGLANEAQLAAVLGHEVGHVTARHAVQGIQRGMLLNLGMTILSETAGNSSYGGLARKAGELAATLIDRSYSRDQERQADRLGIDYMVRAGYNPLGAVELQEYFLKKSDQERNPLWIEGLFRTHPFSRDRLRANRNYIARRYARAVNHPDYELGAKAFLRATAALRASAGGYELYDKARGLEKENKLDQAASLYRRAIAAAPRQALIRTALARTLIREEAFGPAGKNLRAAIRLDDGYYESHLLLGYLALKRGKAGRAAAELEQSMKLLPTVGGAFFLAEARERQGDLRRAVKLYREVAAAVPNTELGRTAAVRVRALAGRSSVPQPR